MDFTNGKSSEEGVEFGDDVQLDQELSYRLEDGTELHFRVVGIVEDEEEGGESFAVAYEEESDQFIVTDSKGDMLEDEELAQEILDNFQTFAEESSAEQP